MKKRKDISGSGKPRRRRPLSLKKSSDIVLMKIEELKEHEETRPDYLEMLKNEILSDGILKMPIAVDKHTLVILDGHHRLQALKRMGCTKIPCILLDYRSGSIEVYASRSGETVTKELVIETALAGRKMAPKTSTHMVLMNGERKHISAIEKIINMLLEELK
jgi:hypothetical protein